MLRSLSRLHTGPKVPQHAALRQATVCGGSLSSGNGGGFKPDQRRALKVLSGARLFDLRQLGNQLGGTLVVDDDSHKLAVQKAVKEKKISFGFSAGGCLFPYYIGAAGALIDAGILTDEIKLGGASAGSLLAACIKADMPLDGLVESNMRLMSDLRQGGTRGRLGPVLENFLRENLPEDAHTRCKDRAYVSVTRITPLARPSLVSEFHSRDDLIEALLASCHIPLWMNGNIFTKFRGERSCDGGLTNFIPIPPDTVGIRICCFPSKQLSPVYRIGISPDNFEPWDYTLRQMLQWAFEPADEAVVAALIDKGKEDTQAWMESMDLHVERAAAEDKAVQGEGHVSAAKEAAIGSADTGKQQQAEQEGEQKLEARAQQDTGSQSSAAQFMERQVAKGAGAQGEGQGQAQALEAAAKQQDAAGGEEVDEEACEKALKEAQEKEAEEGNLWAKALSAAGVAASAAALAATVLP